MKQLIFSIALSCCIISCGIFSRENDPKDIQAAQHYAALFYDQIMAGNRDAAVDSMFLDVINATGKKALNALHAQYGALVKINFKKTHTLVKNTDDGDKIVYKLIVTETYEKKTIDTKMRIDNQSGKLKISGYDANVSKKEE